MEPYENLANAIIMQAVKDWRNAARRVNKKLTNYQARKIKREIEAFLLSDWFKVLTDIDGEMILNRLREEAK